MALEDISLFRSVPHSLVFYPSDAVAMEWAMVHAANHKGAVYIRCNRPDTPVFYSNEETFKIGESKLVHQHDDSKVTIISAGVTLNESFEAKNELIKEGIHVNIIDLFCVKPIDPSTIRASAHTTNGLILVVEDHYVEGGLTDAVRAAVSINGYKIHQLAVHDVP
jgi:transketolase